MSVKDEIDEGIETVDDYYDEVKKEVTDKGFWTKVKTAFLSSVVDRKLVFGDLTVIYAFSHTFIWLGKFLGQEASVDYFGAIAFGLTFLWVLKFVSVYTDLDNSSKEEN